MTVAISAGNVTDLNNPLNVAILVDWGDGTTNTYSTTSVPGLTWSGVGSHFYSNPLVTHVFPATGSNVKCEYIPEARLVILGVPCPTALGTSPTFVRWNKDNENSGVLRLSETVTFVTNLQVCAGDSPTVTFTDRTTLNCIPPALSTAVNDNGRWRRFVYGTQNTMTGSVLINGVAQVFPFNTAGVPAFTTTASTALPVPITTNNITVPATATITQFFEITMQYWNVCNPYDDPALPGTPVDIVNGDNAPVTTTARITIIGSPGAPTVNSPILCETASTSGYNITATPTTVAGSARFTWYKDAALAQVLQALSADNTFNPVTEGPIADRINPAVTGSQTFTRYVTVTQGSNNCTSQPTTITIRIDDTNSPGTIAHPLSAISPITICSGTDPAAFTSSLAAVGGGPSPPGLTYQWQSATNAAFTAGVTNIPASNSAVFDPGPITSDTYFRRTASSGQCATVFSNIIGFVVNTPVVAGSILGGTTLCSGSIPPVISNQTDGSGGNGTPSYTWESSTDNVLFTTIPLATSSSFTPTAPIVVTTYFRRVNTSGVCVPTSAATTPSIVMTVNGIVNPGTIGNPQTICSGANPTTITSTGAPSGGNGIFVFKWEESLTGGGIGFGPATGVNNGATYDPPILTTTTFYRRTTSSGVCSDVPSNEIKITVNPLPTITGPIGGGSVCSGNPAPDIVWTLTGKAPFDPLNSTWTDGVTVFDFTEPGTILTATSFTITSPITLLAGSYEIISLRDANGCDATAFGGTATIIIGGTAPSLDNVGPPALSFNIACNGNSAIDPTLTNFSLDAGSANSAPPHFTLNYTVDGLSKPPKTFATDASGDPTAPISFSDIELDNLGPHTINLVSLISPTGCLTNLGIALSYTVRPLPTVSIPPSPIICDGGNASFNVTTTGTDLSFQWQEKIGAGAFANIIDGGIYSGATTSTLTLTGATLAMSTNQYRVIVTGYNLPSLPPLCPITSSAGTLTVRPLPTVNNLTPVACSDSGAGTTATIPDLTLLQPSIDGNAARSFAWFENYNAGTKVFSTPIATTNYVVTNGVPIFVRVTNTSTTCVSPATVIYTINPKADITVPPPSPVICDGDNTSFSVTATGPGITYQWQINGVNIVDGTFGGVTFAGSTTSNLTLTNVNTSLNARQFRVVTTTTGSCSLISSFGTLTVNPLPSVSAAIIPISYCSDIPTGNSHVSDLTLINATINPTATITWWLNYSYASKTFGSPIAQGNLPGEDETYTIINGDILFAKVVDNVTFCVNVAEVRFTVNPTPVANPIFGPNKLCQGADFITYSLTTVVPGSTYVWTLPTGPGQFVRRFGGGINDPFVLIYFPNVVSTPGLDITVQEISPDGCPAQAVQTYNIQVETTPPPIVITSSIVGDPSPFTVCANSSKTYEVAFLTNTTYAWDAGTASIIGGQGTNKIIVNFGTISTTIKVTPSTATGCAGTPDTKAVTVLPLPVLDPNLNKTVCSKDISGIQLVASLSSTAAIGSYDITAVSYSAPGLIPIVGPTAGTGLSDMAIFNDQYENNTGGPIDVRYTIIPVSVPVGGVTCNGFPATIVTLTVNPSPTLSGTLSKAVCSGSPYAQNLAVNTGSYPATGYKILSINPNGLTATAGLPTSSPTTIFPASEMFDDVWSNPASVPIDVSYTIAPVSTIGALTCEGDPVVVTLTIAPLADAFAIPFLPICSGGSTNILLTDLKAIGGTTFSWTIGPLTSNVTGASADFGSVISQTLLSSNGTTSGQVQYLVTPTVYGCKGSAISVIQVVNPLPVITNTSSALNPVPVCSGVVNFTPLSSVPGTTFTITSAVSAGIVIGNTVGPFTAIPINDVLTNLGDVEAVVTYKITPSAGPCIGNSVFYVFRLSPLPDATAIGADICSGGTTSISISNPNTITGTTFSWTVPAITNINVTGAVPGNGNTISQLLTVTDGVNMGQVTYQIVATAAGCSGLPYDFIQTVNPSPTIINTALQLTNNSYCSNGGSLNFTASTSIAGAQLDWISTVVSGTVSGNTAAGQNTILDNLINTGSSPAIVKYTITPSIGGSCAGPSKDYTVIVNPVPTVDTGPILDICSGVANSITINNPNGVPGTTFSWVISPIPGNPNNVTGATGGSGVAINQILSSTDGLNVGTVTYRITPVANSCPGAAIDVVQTVNPIPQINNTLAQLNPTVCSNSGALNFTASTNIPIPAANLDWFSISSGLPVGNTASGSGIITDNLINAFNSSGTVTYKITPSLAGCSGATRDYVVTVLPLPSASATNPAVCSGFNSNVFISNPNGVTGTTFTWTVPGASVINVTGASPGSGTSILQTLTSTDGVSPGSVIYRITPRANGCDGTPIDVSVIVNISPVGSNTSKTDICSSTPFNFNPQTNITNGLGSTFTWIGNYGSLTGGLIGTQVGNVVGTLVNKTTGKISAFYTVTPTSTSAGNCVGLPFTIEVPINPEPFVTNTNPATICSNNASSLVFASQIVGSTFAWNVTNIFGAVTGIALADNASTNPVPNVIRNRASSQAKITYTVIPTGPAALGSCAGQPKDIVVAFDPEPVMALPALSPICSDVSTGLSLGTNGTSVAATDFLVQAYTNASALPENVANVIKTGFTPLTAVTSTQLLNEKFTNKLATSQTIGYTIIPRGPSPLSCLGDAVAFTVTIKPEPFLNTATVDACSGDKVNLLMLPAGGSIATIDQYTYAGRVLEAPLVADGANQVPVQTFTVNNFLRNDVFYNTATTFKKVTYTVIPTTNGCDGDPYAFVQNINPAPDLLNGISKIVCQGASSTIALNFESTSTTATGYNILSITKSDPSLTQTAGNFTPPVRSNVAASDLNLDAFTHTKDNPELVTYSVQPVAATGCKGAPENVVLTVEPVIKVGIIVGAAAICSDRNVNIQLSSVTTPSTGLITFDIAVPATTVQGFNAPRNGLPSPSTITDLLTNNTNSAAGITYNITPRATGAANGLGCSGAGTTTITVEPKPKLNSITTKTICENDATLGATPTALSLTSPTVPSTGAPSVSFDVSYPTVPAATLTGFTVAGTNLLVGTTLNDQLVTTSLSVDPITYTFTPKFTTASTGVCLGDPTPVTVNVSPRPKLDPISNQVVCSSEVVSLNFNTTENDPAFTIINWTTSAAPSGVTGVTSGGGNAFTQILTNTNSLDRTITYTAIPKNVATIPQCAGRQQQFTIQIYPSPKITPISAKQVCHALANGLNVNLASASDPTITSFSWSADAAGDLNLSGGVGGSGSAITQTLQNNGSSLGFYTYTITSAITALPTCTANAVMIVSVAPKIKPTVFVYNQNSLPDDDTYICKGSPEFVYIQLKGHPFFNGSYTIDGGSPISLTRQGLFNPIQLKPLATTTYRLTSLKDGYGCDYFADPTRSALDTLAATINVGATDPSFTMSALQGCSPFTPIITYNQKAGIRYTWSFGDGSPDFVASISSVDLPNQIVPSHQFENENPNADFKPKVTLSTEFAANYPAAFPNSYPTCLSSKDQQITIYRKISPNVFTPTTSICSGEKVKFTNNSQGVTSHRWYWQNTGTNQVNELSNSKTVEYLFVNNGPLNPQPITVLYESNNGNCQAPTQVIDLLVYQGMTADFIPGPVPDWNGSSTVSFVNNSVPVNNSQFNYAWSFGLAGDALPDKQATYSPLDVTYASPGDKDIVLTVTNKVAEAAGLSCEAQKARSIFIKLPPLAADFDVDPALTCFPTTIKIKNIVATGPDGAGLKYEWILLNAGEIELKSNLRNPEQFSVSKPGIYTITFTVTSPSTGQLAIAGPKNLTVYDKPIASFDTRPDVVFVPDTEMTAFNFSKLATSYSWDFGDGGTSTESDPKYTYQVEGIYDVTLIAKDDHGNGVICADTAVRKVTAKQGGQAKIPNAFTPNVNGPSPDGRGANGTFNDVFLPLVKGIPNDSDAYNLQIYDRWGNLIFESTSSTRGWDGYNKDGKLMPAGVYVYKLTLRFSDSQRTTQVGDVTMIH
ncbi:MAG: PKD-like domain-containing protein [Cyclobacteriaceae bacterium]